MLCFLEDLLASTDILGGVFSHLFIGLLLIYNSVLVSGIQHSDSVICLSIYSLSDSFLLKFITKCRV